MAHQEFDPSALLDALTDRPDVDVVRQMVAWLYQALIDAEATEVIGAAPHERSITRTTRRNGTRTRKLSSKAGDLELTIPKLRKGSFFPSIGAVNPTLTIIANALRVADHLKERMG